VGRDARRKGRDIFSSHKVNGMAGVMNESWDVFHYYFRELFGTHNRRRRHPNHNHVSSILPSPRLLRTVRFARCRQFSTD